MATSPATCPRCLGPLTDADELWTCDRCAWFAPRSGRASSRYAATALAHRHTPLPLVGEGAAKQDQRPGSTLAGTKQGRPIRPH